MTTAEQVHPIQNMGLIDRMVRFSIGAWVVGMLVFYYRMHSAMLPAPVMFYIIAVCNYLIWASMTGWDPLYALFHLRSGNDAGRNPCGTFPYQVKAILGRAPLYCDTDDERSLEACHVEPQERPVHKVWQVDQEPMIYPDDKTLDEFIVRHMPDRAKARRPAAAMNMAS